MCGVDSHSAETNNTGIPDFVHLHGHTKYSVGDATSEPKDLVRKAFEDGQRAIAVTDHGIASSWIQMYKACKAVTEEAQEAERARLKEAGLPVDEEKIKKIGIKFIPGVEIYETNDRLVQSRNEMKELGYSTHHFLLLPKNNEGLKNLNRIISDASITGKFDGKNRTDMKTIEKNGWGKNLIATSACLSSRTSELILDGKLQEAEDFALWCANIFDEFYLELQDNNLKDQYIVNQGLIEISKKTGLPLVFTQDYHYLEEDEADFHDTWICIGRGQEKADPNRQGYDGGPYHFATKDEMYQSVLQGFIPQEAYDNTVKIAEKCSVEFDLKRNRFPKYKFLQKGHTADSHLSTKCHRLLNKYIIDRHRKGKPIDAETYFNRLEKELGVLRLKGFSDYFLIIDDIVGFCHRKGIPVGPGRGSAAGSLITYLLKITRIDPIEHDLLFERFLNPERSSMPDIDIDFPPDRRDEIFAYIADRFGRESVAQIITYGQSKLKSAVNDLCRALEERDENKVPIKYGKKMAEEINKSVPSKLPDQSDPTYAKMKDIVDNPKKYEVEYGDRFKRAHAQATQFMQHMNQHPELAAAIQFIEGKIRNFGKHAAAVVITDGPITDHIPVYKLKREDALPVTAFAMKEIDGDLGMLKLDALALSTMTIIQQAVDNINAMDFTGKQDFDAYEIPLDDPETYRTLRDGHTIGVFQLSGGPITQYTKRVRPYEFSDVVDILSGFRPGPLEAEVEPGVTMTDRYIMNADKGELYEYMETIPESVKDIYEKSRGVMLYQEQILQLAQRMAGYSLGGADLLRRAIGKKDLSLLKSLSYEFTYGTEKGIPLLEKELEGLKSIDPENQDKQAIETYESQIRSMKKALSDGKGVIGAVNNGYEEDYSLTTFHAIENFAKYAFNKSHSAAYGLLSVYSAYMKTHYPVEFMAAQLSVQAGDGDDTIANIEECRRMQITILPPDINKSGEGYNIEFVDDLDENGNKTGKVKKALRFGFSSINGVGPKVVQEILNKRENDEDSLGEFLDLEDFYNRVDKRIINKGPFEKLIKAGCFDFDEPNRHKVLNEFYFDLRKEKRFDGTEKEYKRKMEAGEITKNTMLSFDEVAYDVDLLSQYEKDLFGLYLSHHPFDDLPYVPWNQVGMGQPVDMGGQIVRYKKIKTRNGDPMCFLGVETAGGVIEVTVFPRQFETYQTELYKGNIAIFRGKKDNGNGKEQMILDKMLKATKKKAMIAEKPEELKLLEQQKKAEKKKKRKTKVIDNLPPLIPKPNPIDIPVSSRSMEEEEAMVAESMLGMSPEDIKEMHEEMDREKSFDLSALFSS